MSHTPSPITPTDDQTTTIRQVEGYGDEFGVDVDAGPLDVNAYEQCAHDWAHGWATVCLPTGDALCPPCTRGWLRWHTSAHVAIDVLRVPTTNIQAVAA